MKELTQEEIRSRIVALPLDLQEAIVSTDTRTALEEIVKQNHLHVDQAGVLSDVVELTLGGIVRTREFIVSLQEELPDLPHATLLAVAEQVNKRIFAKVQELLRQIDTAETESEAVAEVAQAEAIYSAPLPVPPMPSVPSAPIPAVPVYDLKSAGAMVGGASTRDVSHISTDPRLKLVPDDLKQKINSDPYKESI